MLSRLAIIVLGLSLATLAPAQSLPALAGSGTSQTALVSQLLALDDGSATPWLAAEPNSLVPIWSGADGHLLAIVAVPGQWGSRLLAGTTAQPGPASWYLLGGMPLESSGLRWQSNTGFHVDALLGQSESTLPSLCGIGCDGSRIGGVTGSLGLGWMSPEGGLDLTYGLSWLQARDGAPAFSGIGAGVPVLTLAGRGFPARVAASAVKAAGLGELATSSEEDFEALAVQLAAEPQRIAAFKRHLAEKRGQLALFDVPAYTRHLEQAYELMLRRHGLGLAPDHLFVERSS